MTQRRTECFRADMLDMILQRRPGRRGRGRNRADCRQKGRSAGTRGLAAEQLAPNYAAADQSNSSIIFGDRAIMKLFRRLESGINPELEIGRFLTEKSCFLNYTAVARGHRVSARADEEPITLGVLHSSFQTQTWHGSTPWTISAGSSSPLPIASDWTNWQIPSPRERFSPWRNNSGLLASRS